MEKAIIKGNPNAYKEERYAKGLCVWCQKPRDCEKAHCAECREKQRLSSLTRKSNRLARNCCVRCGVSLPSGTTGQKCQKCWFNHIALVSLNDYGKGDAIAQMFNEQQGRCAYTNEILIPAVNACIDHKLPRVRGGDSSISNIHWVTKDINRVKGTRTHEEFILICLQIAQKYNPHWDNSACLH